ncbi:MAG: prepilin-type N-terminal cleavage/methylation domain-containing protein [Patescibacteria group bacterium]|jgi:prepilin-type N-terminal cleavage/methylation domain-containing protein|nr:prepilin-type N-terminal cleavage/methylation domain-containing protein [Patescibacteria group bacterium]
MLIYKSLNKFSKINAVPQFRAPSRRKAGFTLIETMVVVTVFVLVMSIALAVFLANVRNHRRALYEQRMVNEVSYALSKAEKEIREGNLVTQSYIANQLSSVMEIDEFKKYEDGERTTILLRTKVKTEENRYAEKTFQITATRR